MRRSLSALGIFALFTSSLLASDGSPVQWPIPEHIPEIVIPSILVSTHWLAEALKDEEVVLLDLRGSSVAEAGRLPGALVLNLRDMAIPIDLAPLRTRLGILGLTGSETVVLYGQGNDFQEIGRAFWLFSAAGFDNIRILDGGIDAWKSEGRTVSATGPVSYPRTFTSASASNSVVVTQDWLRDHFGRHGVELLDLRGTRHPHPTDSGGRSSDGSIPGSLPYSFMPDFEDDGKWPNPTSVREHLGKLGPRPGDFVDLASTFVLYGHDSADPQLGIAYLLLRIAGIEARVFAAGFESWQKGEAVVRELDSAAVAALLIAENPRLGRDLRPKGLIVLDLREARDYSIMGHLPGAYNLPYRPAGMGELFEAIVGYYWHDLPRTSAPIILYCYGVNCVRSRKSAIVIARRGFKNILVYHRSPFEWEADGYPLFESPLED